MELKANELRIGNLLDYYGQIVLVLEIKKNNNIECGYFNDSVGFERKLTEKHSPKPIPLTEEWLLKFGFERANSEKYLFLNLDKTNEAYLYFNPLGKGIAIEQNNRECSFEIKLEYIHQLQNLYFALTNKELEIKM